jgi:hypothetical protein
MIITDSYLAYLFEYQSVHQGSYKGAKEFRDFIGRLAMQLIQKQEHESTQQQYTQQQLEETRAELAAEDAEWDYDDDYMLPDEGDDNHSFNSISLDDPEDPDFILQSDDEEMDIERDSDEQSDYGGGGDWDHWQDEEDATQYRQKQYHEVRSVYHC